MDRFEFKRTDRYHRYFLRFLAKDLSNNPDQQVALGCDLAKRAQLLVADIDIDLSASLADENE